MQLPTPTSVSESPQRRSSALPSGPAKTSSARLIQQEATPRLQAAFIRFPITRDPSRWAFIALVAAGSASATTTQGAP